ncbi:MAG: dUTP diphosphatase [Spirochaetaceae bacterium]|nr:dUTP diphosphatase [Spirochaetaceae bacterium]
MGITVNVKKLRPCAELPSYETAGSSGMDVRACLDEPVLAAVGCIVTVPTGLIFEIPDGYEIQVRPRSGLARRNGITVLNSPGTIDSDYRGELAVVLINLGAAPFTIHHGDRIAQLVCTPVLRISLAETSHISETDRGKGGFGSTGL